MPFGSNKIPIYYTTYITLPLPNIFQYHSDPVINNANNERSTVKSLLEKLILEDEQFDVQNILPNTVPDPASLKLESDYACPMGQVVMAPDCGKFH